MWRGRGLRGCGEFELWKGEVMVGLGISLMVMIELLSVVWREFRVSRVRRVFCLVFRYGMRFPHLWWCAVYHLCTCSVTNLKLIFCMQTCSI